MYMGSDKAQADAYPPSIDRINEAIKIKRAISIFYPKGFRATPSRNN
jgi:hypothetical protein